MNRALFPTQYEKAYVDSFHLYWSRANMPSADRLGKGIKAWIKMRHLRPENTILIGCIELYIQRIESTKQVRSRGRDEIVTYAYKPHFASWLNDSGWLDYVERATISKMLPISTQKPAQRPSFKASDYQSTPPITPLRPASQILAERRERDRQNNSPNPVDIP